jgi:hypothetical protein
MNVPAYYISADMNNSMTYQNIIDGRKEFVAYSLQPFISAIENSLSMDDVLRAVVIRCALHLMTHFCALILWRVWKL